MFWVVQENFISNEPKYQELLQALDRQRIPHQVVKMIPFSRDIEPDISPDGQVFCIGGTSMEFVAKRKGWTPGYIGENLEYDKLLAKYGDYMLNSDTVVAELGRLEPPWDWFFARPCTDRKSFSGQLFNKADFDDWRKRVQALDGQPSSWTSLKPNDLVCCASPKEIDLEWRFFVVDGKVITGSLYKRGGTVIYDAQVDERAWEFARQMVEIWQPNKAFCLDVCEANGQMKVLEINSICSAGFYALDMGKFVAAISALDDSK